MTLHSCGSEGNIEIDVGCHGKEYDCKYVVGL